MILTRRFDLEVPMPEVRATDFARYFQRLSDDAVREIVRVTVHGRVVGGYLCARDLAHYEHLKRQERKILMVESVLNELLPALNESGDRVQPRIEERGSG